MKIYQIFLCLMLFSSATVNNPANSKLGLSNNFKGNFADYSGW